MEKVYYYDYKYVKSTNNKNINVDERQLSDQIKKEESIIKDGNGIGN